MLTLLSSYWQFVLYMFIALTTLELLLSPFHGVYSGYSLMVGYIGLSVEATLPLPQIFANHRSRSCKGFRFSVLASWLGGDAMKMFWFFTSTTEIPWAFKLCGIFQACCDAFLGIQYLMYGSGEVAILKEHQVWADDLKPMGARVSNGLGTPTGRRTPVEKEYR